MKETTFEAVMDAYDSADEAQVKYVTTLERENVALKERIAELERELAETKEGWRLGILQKEVNLLPETEAAVHIEELERRFQAVRDTLMQCKDADLVVTEARYFLDCPLDEIDTTPSEEKP